MFKVFIILYHYLKAKYSLFYWRGRSRRQLLSYQDRKIAKHLNKVWRKSPFYKQYHADHTAELPLIDKRIMMESFSQLNTVGLSVKDAMEIALLGEDTREFSPKLEGYTVGLSSGTSGNRGLFLVSESEQNTWAGNILARTLPKSIFTKQRVALCLRANSNLYERSGNGRIQFRFFDLLFPLEEMIEGLNTYQPDVLIAPPFLLKIFLKENTLQINPKRIISVAEVLDDALKSKLEKAYKQDIHQIYQCTEGFLAFTCTQGSLHLNEDLVRIEKQWIDEETRRFSPIITDFTRMTQPIIRYQLCDILIEAKEPCSCGLPFTTIEAIEGRYDDVIYLKLENEEALKAVFPSLICRVILRASEFVKHYEIEQLSINLIRIYLKAEKSEQVKVIRALEAFFVSLACCVPKIELLKDLPIKCPGDKFRRIKRRFKVD